MAKEPGPRAIHSEGRTISALKVRQWLPGWEKIDFDPKYHRKRPPEFFYVFSLSARELRSLSGIARRQVSNVMPRAADLGIQRQHDPERSEEIGRFVEYGFPWSTLSETKRRSDEFHDLRKPGWLPTAIVINMLEVNDDHGAGKITAKDAVHIEGDGTVYRLTLPYKQWSQSWKPFSVPPFEVIDGQHRLWAFDDGEDQGFELPVVAFHGLDISWQAYLFWTINIKPKRINPSLAFDLYPLLRAEDWLDRAEGHAVYRETRSQELTEALWSHESSPWYDRINMLGEKKSQWVAASCLLHCADGWSYLGRSVSAMMRGDPHIARHLAYYAELRATKSLLASQGVGIFNHHHFAVTKANQAKQLESKSGTHDFAWECLDYWSSLATSGDLFVRLIRPFGLDLAQWFVPVGGASVVAKQAQAWFRQWGMDLKSFPDDRDARNASSYQPDGLPNSWQINAPDVLSFVSELWTALEPSANSRFDILDRHILRASTEAHFKAISGRTPAQAPKDFERFVSSIVSPQSFSNVLENEISRFLVRKVIPTDSLIRANISLVLGLATGYGLDANVLAAYQFLVNHWQEGDRIYLFGFSRGAYTVRVLAGLVHKIGLISPEQVNLAGSGQIAYKQFSTDAPEHGLDLNALTDAGSDENGPLPAGRFDNAAQFARITSARWPVIDFVGVWDTVASVFVPRFDRWIYVMSMEELAFTTMNPSVKVFRQAIAIDERRRMFRLNPWDDPQIFMSNPYAPDASKKPQDILQVWFAGVHGDVGASYPEAQCQISKYPLLWMIDEALKEKLTVNPRTVNQLAWGTSRKNSPFQYVAPDFHGQVHNSMNFAWRLLEGLPKNDKYREWPQRKSMFGYYIPCEEPRFIPEGAVIHESVVERMEAVPSYRPVNMPKRYSIFDMPTEPPVHEAAEV